MSEGTEVTLAVVALEEGGEPDAGAAGPPRRTWRRKIIPYLLIAPALIYLAMFFAYPMYEGLILAIYDDEAELPLVDEANLEGDEVGRVAQGTRVAVLGQQGNLLEETDGSDLLTELWFLVEGEQDASREGPLVESLQESRRGLQPVAGLRQRVLGLADRSCAQLRPMRVRLAHPLVRVDEGEPGLVVIDAW